MTFLYFFLKIRKFIFYPYYYLWFRKYKYFFKDMTGFEVGGPSVFFSNQMTNIYLNSAKIDGCNYSQNTVWEGTISDDQYKFNNKKLGKQFILDATALITIKNESYDFLLSCHSLEHIANPLKALKDWSRIIKPGGLMMLILPDKQYTFDRKREFTEFSHILADYNSNILEDDLTHVNEIVENHDLNFDPLAPQDKELFRARCMTNFENRCLHHHVFSFELLKKMLEYCDMNFVDSINVEPYNKVAVAIKS
jgi:SAM-dependent methyltransferase